MKDDRVYLQHILKCCDRIHRFTGGDRDTFLYNEMASEATPRSLQSLAESCIRLSDDLKDSRPDVDWRGIAGFRNVIVHDYLGVDLDLVWVIISRDLPALESAARAMLGELSPE